ncbi:hypothetical protein [Sandaracinus amylolyticus]|uniref:Uncharacterized protein n=1 Tax=Sandaracinus amylolyticus TaxID=927083 RepID=A0A0F6YIG4_9BACT|nr:hypothetical protein [Sandaracinus amylolyticus]AKF06076.1 hypothetical protein DB32_003225 [Sandaracinus amylolyticus]
MSDTLALEYLYDSVVARFAADAAAEDPPGTPPGQSFGWREPPKRDAAPRITWVPGDDASGDLGAYDAARNPGANPRALATLHELVTVYVEASDPTSPENERAQYRATRLLYDAWLRAVYLAARGMFEIRVQRWMNERSTRRHGAAIRVVLSIEAMVPDAPFETAPVDTEALVTTHLEPNDDEGETDTVSAT